MESDKVTRSITENQTTLEHLSDLLHLFHHRNRNQHRHSVWWRRFSSFRKQVNKLVAEVQSLNLVPSTHLARARKKAGDVLVERRVAQRLSFWRDVLVPKWQHAFSQVTADARFAMLGLVLIAALAQICRIAGITAAIDELGRVEMEKVLGMYGKEASEDDAAVGDRSAAAGEDLGEVISRTSGVQNEGGPGTSAVLVEPEVSQKVVKDTSATTDRTPKRKKRKRTGDAIDDLFSSLD